MDFWYERLVRLQMTETDLFDSYFVAYVTTEQKPKRTKRLVCRSADVTLLSDKCVLHSPGAASVTRRVYTCTPPSGRDIHHHRRRRRRRRHQRYDVATPLGPPLAQHPPLISIRTPPFQREG
jgi:hypothetical protein